MGLCSRSSNQREADSISEDLLGMRLLVVFLLANGDFEGGLHRGSSCFLNLPFHFVEAGGCIQLDLQRYCHLHERFLPVVSVCFLTVAASLSFFNPQ